MAEKYSELEVAPNEQSEGLPKIVDPAALAPERDLSGESPELDKKSWPPQVRCPVQILFLHRKFSLLTCLSEPLSYLRDHSFHPL